MRSFPHMPLGISDRNNSKVIIKYKRKKAPYYLSIAYELEAIIQFKMSISLYLPTKNTKSSKPYISIFNGIGQQLVSNTFVSQLHNSGIQGSHKCWLEIPHRWVPKFPKFHTNSLDFAQSSV